MKLTEWMDSTWYPEHGDNWDDVLFREQILQELRPTHSLLDLGAGAGIVPQMDFRGLAARTCGVDQDERVRENPFVDEGKVGVGEDIPYEEESFNVVIADNVLEHLDDPESVFTEVARVLKPGGRFLAKTPNRWHYVALIARVTPHRFHRLINGLRGRKGEDTFPTRYRVNTPADLTRYARLAGLRVRRVVLAEGRPEYMRINPLSYAIGCLYERAVNRLPWLRRFRVLLIAVFEKE